MRTIRLSPARLPKSAREAILFLRDSPCLAGLAVFAGILVAGWVFCLQRAVHVQIRLDAPLDSGVQVYYRESGQPFSDRRCIPVRVHGTPAVADVQIPIRRLRSLKINFGVAPGEFTILGGYVGPIPLPPWIKWYFSPDIMLKGDAAEAGELKLFSNGTNPHMIIKFRRPIQPAPGSTRVLSRERLTILLFLALAASLATVTALSQRLRTASPPYSGQEAPMNTKQRIRYLDTLKLFAIFIVFATHFIFRFHYAYLSFWHQSPTSWILHGVTGKLGVAVFSVILGFFAYKSKESNVTKYVIKRYIYFLLCGLFINSVYAALGNAGILDAPHTVKEVITASFSLDDEIFPTFWCIRPFFVASILSKLNGKAEAGTFTILVEIFTMYQIMGSLWVSICLMGNLIAIAMSNEKFMSLFKHTWIRRLAYLAVFFLIKRPESGQTYIIDGICASLTIVALGESRYLRKVLDREPLAVLGKNTMAMFLVHVAVYRLVGQGCMLQSDSSVVAFVIAMIVSWTLVVVLSFPLTRLLDALLKLCMKPLEHAMESVSRFFDTKKV